MAETQELRLKINAAAARAGAREFVAAINSIQVAVTQLARESTKAFDQINSGSKSLGQNLRVLQDGYNSARIANDRFAASVKRANAALTRQLNLASQSRGALSGGPTASPISGGSRAADQQISSQNRIQRAVDNTKVSVERLTASLMKVGGFESINKIAAAFRTFQKEVSGSSVSAQQLDNAKTKLNSTLKAAQSSLISLNAKAQENARAERAAAQAAREPAQLAAAAAVRQAEQETARLTARMHAVGDTRGISALNQSLVTLRANLAGGATSALQVRQAMSQFADSASRAKLQLAQMDAAQRAAAARARELAAQERAAAAEARRLAGEIRAAGASSQNASRSFRQATGSLRGLENAFSSSFQIGSAFRTMIGTITLGTFAQSVFRAGDALEQFNITMEVASGSAAAAASDLSFIDDMARNLGTNLGASRDAFSKFAVSSQIAGVSTDQTREIFESVSTAMSVLGRGTEDQRLAFLALEQMMSKGVISAEELRRQLGERLPGAVSLMARAVGVSVSELQDMLKAGELISSEVLPKFADELNKTFGSQLDRTFNRAGSNLGRMQVEFQKLFEIVANTGFLNELSVQFRDITSALQTSEIQEAAAKLGRGFAEAAEVFGQSSLFIINNIEEIGRIATVVIGTLIARQFALLAQSALAGAAALVTSVVQFRAVGAAATAAAGGLGAAGSGAAGAAGGIGAAGAAAGAAAGGFTRLGAGLTVAGRAFGVLAGPIGLAITALTLVPAFLDDVGTTAQDAAFDYGDAIREMEGTTFRFSAEIIDAQNLLSRFQNDAQAGSDITNAFEAIRNGGALAGQTGLADTLKEMEDLDASIRNSNLSMDEWLDSVSELKKLFNDVRGQIPEDQIRRLEDTILPAAALVRQIAEDAERLELASPGFADKIIESKTALEQARNSVIALRDGLSSLDEGASVDSGIVSILDESRFESVNDALDQFSDRLFSVNGFQADGLINQFDELREKFHSGEIGAGELQTELASLVGSLQETADANLVVASTAGFEVKALQEVGEAAVTMAGSLSDAEQASFAAEAGANAVASAADNVAASGYNGAAGIQALSQAFANLGSAGDAAVAAIGGQIQRVERQIELRSMNFVDRSVGQAMDRQAELIEEQRSNIENAFNSTISAAGNTADRGLLVAAAEQDRAAALANLDEGIATYEERVRTLATTPLNNEGRPTATRSNGGGRRSSGGGRSGASDAAKEAERAAKAIKDLKDALDESIVSIETENVALGLLASGMTSSERGAKLLAEAQIGGANLTREQTAAFIEQIEAAEALNASLTRLANDPVNDWMNSVPTWREAGQQIETGVFESLSSSISEFIKTGEFSFESLGESILGIVADIVADKAVKELTTLLGGNTTGSGEGGFGLGGILSDAFGNGGSAGDVGDPFAGEGGGAAMQQAIATGGQHAAETMRAAITQAGQQVGTTMTQSGQQAGAQIGTQVQTAGSVAGSQMSTQTMTGGAIAGSQMAIQTQTGGTVAAQQMQQGIMQGGAAAASQMAQASAGGGGGGGLFGGGFGGVLLGAGLSLASSFLNRSSSSSSDDSSAATTITPVGVRQFAEGTANTSGIPAILHPNEAVIPLTKGRKVAVDMENTEGAMGGSKTVVQNFNISTPDADSFRKSQKQIAADAASSGQRAMSDNG